MRALQIRCGSTYLLGGYIPVFVAAGDLAREQERLGNAIPISIRPELRRYSDQPVGFLARLRRLRNRPLVLAILLTAYSAVLLCIAWFAAVRVLNAHSAREMEGAAAPLWDALFGKAPITYIVPADAGLNLPRRSVASTPAAGGLHPRRLFGDDAADDGFAQRGRSALAALHQLCRSADCLRTGEGCPQSDPQHTVLRFHRDLRLDDLRNANAVIVGSVGSNPWTCGRGEERQFPNCLSRGDGRRDDQPTPSPNPERKRPTSVTGTIRSMRRSRWISCLPNLEEWREVELQFCRGWMLPGRRPPPRHSSIRRQSPRFCGARLARMGRFATSRYCCVRQVSESGAAGTQVIGSRIY